MIFRPAGLTLQEIFHAADGQDGNDEEKRDETHSTFLYETADGAAVATAHLSGLRL